jgi:hypothetical protein
VVIGEALVIEALAEHIAQGVVARQGALRSEVTIRASYPVERLTPITGIPTQETHELIGIAAASSAGTRRLVGVSAQGMNACPCAQGLVGQGAAEALLEDGFTVLPYMHADPVLATRLEAAGCHAVMPLAAPIGSGRGLKLRDAIRIIVEQAHVPVVVDAGLGAPSHAAEAMEMGADAVLVNTAIAKAGDPVEMARAFRLGVEAGRAGFLAGVMPELETASPSSPLAGVVR